jgi:hypothetical protein
MTANILGGSRVYLARDGGTRPGEAGNGPVRDVNTTEAAMISGWMNRTDEDLGAACLADQAVSPRPVYPLLL